MKKLYVKEACAVCEEEREGMYVYSTFICWDCEREIVHTEPESEKYGEFVKKLSKIRKPSIFS